MLTIYAIKVGLAVEAKGSCGVSKRFQLIHFSTRQEECDQKIKFTKRKVMTALVRMSGLLTLAFFCALAHSIKSDFSITQKNIMKTIMSADMIRVGQVYG